MPLSNSLPSEIRTRRLVLRRQHPDDAPLIKDALDTSLDHLSSVSWGQAAPTLLAELTARPPGVDLAFARLGAQRVAICHDPANAPSAGVTRRLGFRFVGLVTDAVLPGRQAADGSMRTETMIWVLDASGRSSAWSAFAR